MIKIWRSRITPFSQYFSLRREASIMQQYIWLQILRQKVELKRLYYKMMTIKYFVTGLNGTLFFQSSVKFWEFSETCIKSPPDLVLLNPAPCVVSWKFCHIPRREKYSGLKSQDFSGFTKWNATDIIGVFMWCLSVQRKLSMCDVIVSGCVSFCELQHALLTPEWSKFTENDWISKASVLFMTFETCANDHSAVLPETWCFVS